MEILNEVQKLIIQRMRKFANTKIGDRQNAFNELAELGGDIARLGEKYE